MLWKGVIKRCYEKVFWRGIMKRYYEKALWKVVMKRHYEKVLWKGVMKRYNEKALWKCVKVISDYQIIISFFHHRTFSIASIDFSVLFLFSIGNSWRRKLSSSLFHIKCLFMCLIFALSASFRNIKCIFVQYPMLCWMNIYIVKSKI